MENKNKPENPSSRDHLAELVLPVIARTYSVQGYVDAVNVAKDCYAIADAMLKERGKS